MYKLYGVTAVLAICIYVWLVDGHLSSEEKLNIAFPPNAEVRIGLESLEAMVSNDPSHQAFRKSWESRMNLRAVTCSQDVTLSRFDSIDRIKKLPVNKDCLKEQDEQLLEFIGIRLVGVRSTQPPLKPLVKLGPPTLVQAAEDMDVYSGFAAADAGVLVLRGTRGEFISVELPSGKKISSIQTVPEASHNVTLSPNGRVTAIPVSNRELVFVDNESGEKLWATKSFNQVLVWVPEISSVIVKNTKNGGVSLIDFQKGKVQPYPVSIDNPTWGLRLAHSPFRVIIGSAREFSIIENTRTLQGIEASTEKLLRFKSERGVTSSAPILMLKNKALFFVSSRDFMLVDLETGAETFWETGDLLSNQYAKLTDETVLVDSYASRGSGKGMKPFSFNVQDATLTAIENEEAKSGIIYGLGERSGFMRRGHRKVWVGEDLQLGETTNLAALVEARNLEKQLAMLEAQARSLESGSAYSNRGYPATEMMPSAPAAMPVIGSPELEAKKAELARKREERLGNLDNVEVHAVGLYQGCSSRLKDRKCPVIVKVKRTAKPIVLVLSSYESIRWTLVREPGSNLSAVIVTGYDPSEVVGQGSARVVVRERGPFAYKREDPRFISLNNEVQMLTGKSISKFHGAYESRSMEVGP